MLWGTTDGGWPNNIDRQQETATTTLTLDDGSSSREQGGRDNMRYADMASHLQDSEDAEVE